MKRLAIALLAVVALNACATFNREPRERKTSHGPTARLVWMMRQMAENGREPNIDERRHWEDQLEQQISAYLRQDPEAANALHVSSFRFDKQVVTGMTKEQVLILLGAPSGVTSDQAEMEKLARKYWRDLQGNVNEAWVYELGSSSWRFYFTGRKLAAITMLERD